MKIKQIHKNIGVSIEGIDLSRIDNNVFQQIKDLWLKHLIIIFPNQNISDEEHIKFGKNLVNLKFILLYPIDPQKILKYIVYQT